MLGLDLLPMLGPWLICAVAVIVGTMLQKLSGAGFGILVSPIMMLVAPEWVPGTVLLLGLFVGLGAFFGARDAIIVADLPPGLVGRVIGAVAAAWIARIVVGSPALPVVVACIVFLAIALSLAGFKVPISKMSLLVAGTAGGLMGTLSGIGGPPMAILYSTAGTRRSAASQNAFFGFGMIFSITALAVAGLIRAPQIVFAVSLLPLIPLSLVMSRPLSQRFERGSIRPWTLGLATLSAILLLFRSL